MKLQKLNKKQMLIDSARELIYKKGYKQTSLADVAKDSNVPLGNVYHYFKKKSDLVDGVIASRKQQLDSLYAQWEQDPDIKNRVRCLLNFARNIRKDVAVSGCPIGSLCQELNKEQSMSSGEINNILSVQADWLKSQFSELVGDVKSEDYARHVVVVLQGACLMTQALKDPSVMNKEIDILDVWITNLD